MVTIEMASHLVSVALCKVFVKYQKKVRFGVDQILPRAEIFNSKLSSRK